MQDLLEDVCAHQSLEDFLLMNGLEPILHAFLDPSAPVGIRDVHKLHTDGSAVEGSCEGGGIAIDIQLRNIFRRDNSERIYPNLQVSQPAEGVQDCFFRIGLSL